ncbi:prepilin-type N-terminal cleavage/methylation domain-containing protein [Congregibacter sp.]|uniref:prepilin-type N-terminal cleavage/methylation domain-containing protein n=1 Tax=Congregibacter sp. TaxID=2744308 RepID=UPI003F6BE9E8
MKRSASGFTLVEVLVASTVLSLVLMLTVSAMRMIGSSSSKVVAVVDRNDEMRTVSLFLHDVLRRAEGSGAGGVPVYGGLWSQVSAQQSSYFKGGADYVAWLASSAVIPGSNGQQYLRLSRDKGELVLQSKAYQGNEEEPDWGTVNDTKALMKGVSEFEVSYRWSPEEPWGVQDNDQPRLPAAVKIQIRSEEKYWPDIVVKFDNYSAAPGP